MADHEVVVVRSGMAGWIVAGALVAAAIIGALFYANGYFERSNTIELQIELPAVDLGN